MSDQIIPKGTIIHIDIETQRAFDSAGKDLTKFVSHRIRQSVEAGESQYWQLKGNNRWYAVTDQKIIDEYEDLLKKAQTNVTTGEWQSDIKDFLDNSPGLMPEELVMDDIRWKFLVRSILRGQNIMMTGPSGCAKTFAAQSAAKAFPDREYFYFNLGQTQDARSTLIGNTHFTPEEGTFTTPALFVKAIQTENAIILLDELSRAHPDAHNILMTVLDPLQKYLRIDDDPNTPTINVADGVTFIATANVGAEYTATRVIDRALQDRFVIAEIHPLDKDGEMTVLSRKYPELPTKTIEAIAEIACHTRDQVVDEDPEITTAISTRSSLAMAGLIYDGFSLEEAAELAVYPYYSEVGGAESERTYVKTLVQKYIHSGDPNGLNVNLPDEFVEDLAMNA
ncbi:MAG: AAA family ATPase [Betaproteobacteria bacterium]|jgi:MoxR-like ATPase